MTPFIIAIFFVAILTAFGMLSFRAWKLRTGRVSLEETRETPVPNLSFRQIEKTVLYLTKYIVVSTVVGTAKYWFIITTKTKKKAEESWPRIHKAFTKKPKDPSARPSLVKRSVAESKIRIRRVKEKVKREHGQVKVEEQEESVEDN